MRGGGIEGGLKRPQPLPPPQKRRGKKLTQELRHGKDLFCCQLRASSVTRATAFGTHTTTDRPQKQGESVALLLWLLYPIQALIPSNSVISYYIILWFTITTTTTSYSLMHQNISTVAHDSTSYYYCYCYYTKKKEAQRRRKKGPH